MNQETRTKILPASSLSKEPQEVCLEKEKSIFYTLDTKKLVLPTRYSAKNWPRSRFDQARPRRYMTCNISTFSILVSSKFKLTHRKARQCCVESVLSAPSSRGTRSLSRPLWLRLLRPPLSEVPDRWMTSTRQKTPTRARRRRLRRAGKCSTVPTLISICVSVLQFGVDTQKNARKNVPFHLNLHFNHQFGGVQNGE